MQAIVVDPNAPLRIGFGQIEPPVPRPDEAVVRVKAISVNRGEVVYRVHGAEGTRLGWDLAGVVDQPAADGSGPSQGTKVVGLLRSGAWAEEVAVPTDALAEMPPSVSFAQAATLPMAGLTALRAVERGASLLARRILITGGSGGVGLFACRLASLAGARLVGQVRNPASASLLKEVGAEHVLVGEDIGAAAAFGPFHLIIDQLGGRVLAGVVPQLDPGGVCVAVGALASAEVPLDWGRIREVPGARLVFFNLWHELKREPASIGLERLVHLVGTGRLVPRVGIEADWHEIGAVAQALIDRQFSGKAVLHVPEE